MSQIYLQGMTTEEFLKKVEQLINTKLPNQGNLFTQTEANYITRKELARLLKISLPTLNTWTKLGWLKAYKMGNRVYYRQQEVETVLSSSSQIRQKRRI